jgi:hypothetical protein
MTDSGARLGANLYLDADLPAEVGTKEVKRSTKEHGGRRKITKLG